MTKYTRVAIMVSFKIVLMASAATAQTPGTSFEGTGESPRGITTATIPVNNTSTAMPFIAGAIDIFNIRRGVLTEDDLRTQYGTITASADGTVRESPASESVMNSLLGR